MTNEYIDKTFTNEQDRKILKTARNRWRRGAESRNRMDFIKKDVEKVTLHERREIEKQKRRSA